MRVLMRGKRLAVEKLTRSSNQTSFLSMPEDSSAVGHIRYVSEELSKLSRQEASSLDPVLPARILKEGMKVAFGQQHHQIKLNGLDLVVMNEDNVYAILEDEDAEAQVSPDSRE